MSEDHASILAGAAEAANHGLRFCQIIDSSIEAHSGGNDGAYGLLNVSGSPEHVGRVIAAYLAEAEIGNGAVLSIDGGKFAYLNVKFRICNPAKGGEPLLNDRIVGWHDCGEGPWENVCDAAEFGNAEVGAEYRILRYADKNWHIQVFRPAIIECDDV